MFYYLKNAAIGGVFGILVVLILACTDCLDGNFTSHHGNYGSYGGCGTPVSTQRTLFALIDDQIDIYSHGVYAKTHVMPDKVEMHNVFFRAYLLTLADDRLKQGLEIFFGSVLVALFAAILRRKTGMRTRLQITWAFAGFVLGIFISCAIVGVTAALNPSVYIQDRWTESIWQCADFGNKFMVLSLIAPLLTTVAKKKELKRLLCASTPKLSTN